MEYTISEKDAGTRLDRWFKRDVQDIPQGMIEKILRQGLLKVNGKKVKSSYRLVNDDDIMVDEQIFTLNKTVKRSSAKTPVSIPPEAIRAIQASVIHIDDEMIAINKPAGLAVQGGSNIVLSVDSMLDYLKFDSKERPRLVHRLDKDTSGVLLLARDGAAATKLIACFKEHQIEKEYVAIIAGTLPSRRGKIDFPLVKSGQNYEKMIVGKEGQSALTYYDLIASNKKYGIELVSLKPKTGRKHQLRVHMSAIGAPIVGDGKYGGKEAFKDGIAAKLHLHAHRVRICYEHGHPLEITAPIEGHFSESLRTLRINYQ